MSTNPWAGRGLGAIGALTALAIATSPARADDDWLGPDKALHFGASAGLAAGGYGASAIWVAPRWERAAIGAAVALSAGAAKEAWDATGRGDPSWKDLAWDGVGTVTGVAIAVVVDLVVAGLDAR